MVRVLCFHLVNDPCFVPGLCFRLMDFVVTARSSPPWECVFLHFSCLLVGFAVDSECFLVFLQYVLRDFLSWLGLVLFFVGRVVVCVWGGVVFPGGVGVGWGMVLGWGVFVGHETCVLGCFSTCLFFLFILRGVVSFTCSFDMRFFRLISFLKLFVHAFVFSHSCVLFMVNLFVLFVFLFRGYFGVAFCISSLQVVCFWGVLSLVWVIFLSFNLEVLLLFIYCSADLLLHFSFLLCFVYLLFPDVVSTISDQTTF